VASVKFLIDAEKTIRLYKFLKYENSEGFLHQKETVIFKMNIPCLCTSK